MKQERSEGAPTTVEATKRAVANLWKDTDKNPWNSIKQSVQGTWDSISSGIDDLWGDEDSTTTFEETEDISWNPAEPDIRNVIVIGDAPGEGEEEEIVLRLSIEIDLDGDGDKDHIQVAHEEDAIIWFENISRNEKEWPKRVIATETRGIIAVDATDVDEDLDKDVVVTLRDGRQFWYENDGLQPPGWVGHIRR